jgi:uncharacterized OB-fold protein
MEKERKNFVISLEMQPEVGMQEERGRDGKIYLLRNDAMFTGMRHSQGEFSDFFIAIRDRCKIFGKRCPCCKQIIIPPFMDKCPKPKCNFAQMTDEQVLDIGVMAASPVITLFAPSRFKSEVPFANGYVFLRAKDGKYTDTAIKLRTRTTTGSMRPAVYYKNTPVKVVFCRERRGEILDVFIVPQKELTKEQIAKTTLLEDELDWHKNTLADMQITKAGMDDLLELREELYRFAELVKQSPRAVKDLAGWDRTTNFVTLGGKTGFHIADGKFIPGQFADADFEIAVQETTKLIAWFKAATGKHSASHPLTDFIMEGTLVLSKSEIETIVRLDRIPRSLRRDGIIN